MLLCLRTTLIPMRPVGSQPEATSCVPPEEWQQMTRLRDPVQSAMVEAESKSPAASTGVLVTKLRGARAGPSSQGSGPQSGFPPDRARWWQPHGLQPGHLHACPLSPDQRTSLGPFIKPCPGSEAIHTCTWGGLELVRDADSGSTLLSPILLFILPRLFHRGAVANELIKHKGLYK